MILFKCDRCGCTLEIRTRKQGYDTDESILNDILNAYKIKFSEVNDINFNCHRLICNSCKEDILNG